MHCSMDSNCLGLIIIQEQSILLKYKRIQILMIFSINLLVQKLQKKLLIQLKFSQLILKFWKIK